jgi:hypothetical protein
MVPVWSLPLVVPGLLAAPPVVLEGETDCPTRDAISRELERIVVAPDGSAPTDTARVTVEGTELYVVLATNDGRLLGERRLPAEGTCDERALSVAVVLGAWITTAHPEYLSALPAAPSEAPAASAEANMPALNPTPAAPPPPSRPAPAAREPEPESKARVAANDPWRFQPAAALGIELSDAGIVPAADVSVRYAPEASGFGLSAFVLLALSEDRAVGSGKVSSFRWPLGVGGVARQERSGVALELDAGAMLGILHVEGEDFTTNDEATDVQGGLYAALRLGASTGTLRPFGAAKLLTWLGKATASASEPNAEVDLPVVEGVFVAGVGFAP